MNITPITFKGIDDKYKHTNRRTSSSNRVQTHQRTSQRDEYVSRRSESSRNPRRTNNHKKSRATVKGFIAGLATALAINGGMSVLDKKNDVVKVKFSPAETTLSELAEQYDCDEDIIRDFNEKDGKLQFTKNGELKIPTEYDCIQPQIDKLVDKLYNSHLSSKKRDEIESKVKDLQEKQDAQQHVAKTYTDGDKVYFLFDFTDENGENQPYARINVETFKDLFNIKDEAIKKYNDLHAVWKKDTNLPEDKGYFDFTGNYFVNGDTILVKKDDIMDEE